MTPGRVAAPLLRAPAVAWRYIGAHTLHTCENCEAWATAAPISAGWTVRSALLPGSVETVGYT